MSANFYVIPDLIGDDNLGSHLKALQKYPAERFIEHQQLP